FRGELAVLLLDLVLRRGRRNAEDCVKILALGHTYGYVLRRSAASAPTALRVPLLDDHARGTKELAVEAVPLLKDLAHGVIVFGRQRGLGRDGFVQRGIERLIERIDHLETGRRERLEQLLLHEVDAFVERLRLRRRRVDVRKAREIIERVQQSGHELRLRARRAFRALAGRALAVVVVLRGQPKIPVTLLGELLRRGDRVALLVAGRRFVGSGL